MRRERDVETSLERLYREVPAAEEEDLLEQVREENLQASIRDIGRLYDDLVLPCYTCGELMLELRADGTCKSCNDRLRE